MYPSLTVANQVPLMKLAAAARRHVRSVLSDEDASDIDLHRGITETSMHLAAVTVHTACVCVCACVSLVLSPSAVIDLGLD